MNTLTLILPILMASIVVLIALTIFIVTLVSNTLNRNHQKWHEIVENNSRYLSGLRLLNRSIPPFHPLEANYVIETTVSSKAKLEHFDILSAFHENIVENKEWYDGLFFKVEQNKERWNNYHMQSAYLSHTLTEEECKHLNVPYKFASAEEHRLAASELRNCPVISPSITYTVNYTSPQGRNSYHNTAYYNFDQIKLEYDQAFMIHQRSQAQRSTVEYERSLMTPSLRYDVLKRDGFRCVLCGRSQRDGITLHVDHIVPVSKGGKTEMSNLRTLCEDCNRGKGAKYDPYGIN